ncbi:hypothetical protein B0T12DRAFT_214197 [Alternaria alternata]|nr:hypothetical protein B0T12DRAFT_214197 [Alternaria alternata]
MGLMYTRPWTKCDCCTHIFQRYVREHCRMEVVCVRALDACIITPRGVTRFVIVEPAGHTIFSTSSIVWEQRKGVLQTSGALFQRCVHLFIEHVHLGKNTNLYPQPHSRPENIGETASPLLRSSIPIECTLPSCLEHRRNTNAHLQRRNVRIQLAFRIPTNTRHNGVLPHDLRKENWGCWLKDSTWTSERIAELCVSVKIPMRVDWWLIEDWWNI